MTDRKVISIHTPKAGGTSTLELLRQAYGVDGVMMDYDDAPANPCAAYLIDPVTWKKNRLSVLPAGIDAVHGHFIPSKYDLLENAFRFTFLRDPVDNLISIYSYWKLIPPQPNAIHQYFLSNNLGIVDLALLPSIRYLYSNTYFGGWDIANLDFVGIHENRENDLTTLMSILDKDVDVTLHLNSTDMQEVNPERERIVTDKSLIKRLKLILQKDIQFYKQFL